MAERVQTVTSEFKVAPTAEPNFIGRQINRARAYIIVGAGSLAVGLLAACGGEDNGVVVEFVTQTPVPVVQAEGQTPTNAPTVKPPTEVSTVSGDGGSKGGNVTVVPTEVPKPTATSTKEATPVQAKSVLEQPVTPVTIDTLKSEVDSFFQAHPEASTWKYTNGSVVSKTVLDRFLNLCQNGDSSSAGQANLIRSDRVAGCTGLVSLFDDLYIQHGQEELFGIATKARSYIIGAYPADQARIDANLSALGIK